MPQKSSGQILRWGRAVDRGCLLSTPKQKDMTDKTELIGGGGGVIDIIREGMKTFKTP